MTTPHVLIVCPAVTLALTLTAAQGAGAQAAPAPTPITGAALGANDPCTSIGAIVTRPTQTTAVCTVRPNHVLIETGYDNTTGTSSGPTAVFPAALVRIGTTLPALEVDVGVPSYERLATSNGDVTGLKDAGLGLKYVFGYTSRFAYGANVFVTAPSGSSGISAGAATQTYNLNYSYTLNSIVGLSATTGIESLASDSGRYTSFTPSLLLTAALPNASGAFAEAAEFTDAAGPDSAGRTQVMVGLTRDIASRVQLDVEVGRSFGSALVRNAFIGFGASYYH